MNKQNLDYGKAPSAIRQLTEYGRKRKLEIGEENVFDFSIGNPNTPAPNQVKDTLINLLNEDPIKIHSYTSSPENIDVRNSIATYLNKTYQASLDGNYIYLTCGAAAGLAIVINAIINEGDEVILFAPYFIEYKVFTEHAKGKVVIVNHDQNLLPDFDDLKAKISAKTRLLIYNSPNNPSGVFYDEEVIKTLTGILKEKEEEYGEPIFLLSDEPYRELLYEGEKYPFITNYYEHSIVTYSFSKSLSLPGERIGYIAINPHQDVTSDLFYAICGAGRALGYIAAPSLFQHMTPHVLGLTSDLNFYKKNRDLLYQNLKEIGYEVIYPRGAFYMMVKSLEDDAYKFSEAAKEYELLLVPSDPFGVKGYVRVCYAVSEKTIINSKEAFRKLYQRYKGE